MFKAYGKNFVMKNKTKCNDKACLTVRLTSQAGA